MNIFISLGIKLIALTVSVPGSDISTNSSSLGYRTSSSTDVLSSKGRIFELLKIVNEYIWFFIFFIAMIVLVWGGIMLITAEGDPAYLKKANMSITYGLIGIVIAVSSYFAVKLLANLF